MKRDDSTIRRNTMNGAESLVQTLLQGGVDVCFSNPGTSEMHFVAALDGAEEMRCVLCLFEGVATGAADGYARMADMPAATLLHLGPGLANGLANIHNARRARSPMVNIVGDHASYHLQYDAPLTTDIEAVAKPFSDWIRQSKSAGSVARDGAEAIRAARSAPGQIATLILPGDTAWNTARQELPDLPALSAPPMSPAEQLSESLAALRSGEPCLLLLAGKALRQEGQLNAARIAARSNAEILAQTSNARVERGAGCIAIDRVPYPVDQALARLAKFRHIILVGAKAPVAFFAYPDKPGWLAPAQAEIHVLAEPWQDSEQALEWLVEALGAEHAAIDTLEVNRPDPPQGKLDGKKLATAVAALLPENAIVADESVSLGRGFFSVIRDVPCHSWIQITGGAIGLGLPMATGAAVACPQRKVISLQADGSAMYTVQALWTQAREGLDVTTVILSNRAYAILKGEMKNVGVTELGPKAMDMLELDRPALDWVSIARGFGVEAARAETAEAFSDLFARGLATPGPFLIEALV